MFLPTSFRVGLSYLLKVTGGNSIIIKNNLMEAYQLDHTPTQLTLLLCLWGN